MKFERKKSPIGGAMKKESINEFDYENYFEDAKRQLFEEIDHIGYHNGLIRKFSKIKDIHHISEYVEDTRETLNKMFVKIEELIDKKCTTAK